MRMARYGDRAIEGQYGTDNNGDDDDIQTFW
jgi:hypothetical protein